MIDFVKIIFRDKINIEPYILDEENFQGTKASSDYHSNVKSYPFSNKIENLDITVNEKSVIIKGSLHIMKNAINEGIEHNYNDFKFSELELIVQILVLEFPDIEFANITNLEFGLNVNTEVPAKQIVVSNILMHNLKSHSRYETFGGKGAYKQFNHSEYLIKIYDKAKHYGQFQNILRFEVKFISRRLIRKLGVSSITDLLDQANLYNLYQYLLRRFEEMYIIDNVSQNQIPVEDYNDINMYLALGFWEKQGEKRSNRNRKAKHKGRFNALLVKHNLITTKQSIRVLLEEKYNELINQ